MREKYFFYTKLMNLYRYEISGMYIPGVPFLIWKCLELKYLISRHAVNRKVRLSTNEIKDHLGDKKLFLIAGVFRSGTHMMSRVLNELLKEGICEHESNVCDYLAYTAALANPSCARQYIDRYRLKWILHKLQRENTSVFVDVNPYLRRHVGALRESCPQARIIHQVRDGRDVVRSLMSREHFLPSDPAADHIRPPEKDPYRSKWDRMSRFEKVCWTWRADNEFLLEHCDTLVQFEKLRSDFDYAGQHILQPLGISCSPEEYFATLQRPLNTVPQYRMPKWEQWSAKDKQTFRDMCGEIMIRCGYDPDDR